MVTCSNCGAVARPGAKFCTVCGSRLDTQDTATTSTDATSSQDPTWQTSESDTAPATDGQETEAAASVAPESEPATSPSSWSWSPSTEPAAEEPVSTTPTEDTATTSSWSWGQSAQHPEGDVQPAAESSDDTHTDQDNADDGPQEELAPDQTGEQAAAQDGDAQTVTPDEAASDEQIAVDANADEENSEQLETLSSWAARWNAEEDEQSTDTTDDEPSAEATSADDVVASFSPLVGAPEEPQPETEASVADATESASSESISAEMESADESMSVESEDVPADAESTAEAAPVDGGNLSSDVEAVDETAPVESGDTLADVESADEPAPLATDENAPADEAVAANDEPDPLVGMTIDSEASAAAPAASLDHAAANANEPDARTRATQLLDELQTLIPMLGTDTASPAETGPTLDLSAIANDLDAARPGQDSNSELRALLERARDNPRDIDAMLELISHAGDLLAVLNAQDHLDAAAGDAIDRLRVADEETYA